MTAANTMTAAAGDAEVIETLEELLSAARLGKLHGVVIHAHLEDRGIDIHALMCDDLGHRFAMIESLEHTARALRLDAGQKLEPLRPNA